MPASKRRTGPRSRIFKVDLLGRIIRPARVIATVRVRADRPDRAEKKALRRAVVILAGTPYTVEAIAR